MRVHTTVTSFASGRRYRRRVRTTEAKRLSVGAVTHGLSKTDKERLPERELYLARDTEGEGYSLSLEPPGMLFKLEATKQRNGKRLWFRCVACSRRCASLYMVAVGNEHIWGCRVCLGLSYPSQCGHKTVWHDNRIMGRNGPGLIGTTPCQAPKVAFSTYIRACIRHDDRLAKFAAYVNRTFPKY